MIQLESSRLLYRPFDTSDAQDLFSMDANPIVHKYLWQKPSIHIDESLQIIDYLLKQYKENGIGPGANAFVARCVTTIESLPPENRMHGF